MRAIVSGSAGWITAQRIEASGGQASNQGLDNVKRCAVESTVSAQAREPPSTGCTKQALVYARISAAPVVIGTGRADHQPWRLIRVDQCVPCTL